MGYLTASMTFQLLRHEKNEKRQKMLKWIWRDDYWKSHNYRRAKRAPHTGGWFLKCTPFTEWRDGIGSKILCCPGIRTVSALNFH